MALEYDWLGAVIGLVRAGPGTPADGNQLVEYIDACPETEGEIDPDDAALMASSFDLVLDTWEAAGSIDEHHRLTLWVRGFFPGRWPGRGTPTSTPASP